MGLGRRAIRACQGELRWRGDRHQAMIGRLLLVLVVPIAADATTVSGNVAVHFVVLEAGGSDREYRYRR